MKGGYYCNQCPPQRAKVTGDAYLPKSTSVVSECNEFETDEANEGTDIKIILAYCGNCNKSTVVTKSTSRIYMSIIAYLALL